MPDRCEELVVMNQAVIDTMTGAYMAKRQLEIAMQQGKVTVPALLAALHISQSEERAAVAARDKHRQGHWCGGSRLALAAGF